MPKAETITSAANPLLKDVRRAVARGGLTSDGLCVADTFHLLDEALRSGREVPVVLAAESVESRMPRFRGRLVVLPDPLLASISATETSQGVIALVRPPEWTMEDLFHGTPLLVALDAIQDPGNAGTIVRSAEAFGATGVLFLAGSVSPHNPKTLRAAAGSLFRLPYLSAPLPPQLPWYAADARAPRPLTDVNWTAACGLIVGNEAHGLSPASKATATTVSIPTRGVESLNAAIAASVLLYEASRQRERRP
jgi:TrmH family RNA methyltransferase